MDTGNKTALLITHLLEHFSSPVTGTQVPIFTRTCFTCWWHTQAVEHPRSCPACRHTRAHFAGQHLRWRYRQWRQTRFTAGSKPPRCPLTTVKNVSVLVWICLVLTAISLIFSFLTAGCRTLSNLSTSSEDRCKILKLCLNHSPALRTASQVILPILHCAELKT